MTDLSVVIATYNRAERLKACLDSLGAQASGVAGAFDVVVVVDGSTDSTMELLAGYHPPFPLKVLWQENAGQPSAANRGVAEATGDFCLLIDDDIVGGPELIAEHLRVQRETGGVVATGRLSLRVPAKADWYVRRFAAGWAAHYARLDAAQTEVTAAACYGNNLSFPRPAFLEVGGFALDLARGYDIDLAHRLIAAGLTPRYLPRAEGMQDERKNWRQLLRDEEGAGASVVAMHRKDPTAFQIGGLGDFRRASRLSVTFRRVLLALDLPVVALVVPGSILDRVGRGRWFRFVREYAFWRGVRRAANRKQWHRFLGGA
jgi:glycosyltransferase involved in cell wall biosynthesis